MFPINLLGYADEEIKELYRACSEQNTGLVSMKVYNGGTLLFVKGKPTGITLVQCLHYALSQPVSTAVPGARDPGELRTTLHYLEASDKEKDYSAVPANIHELLAGQCTYCQHCLPCPQEIEMGWIIWHLDQIRVRGLDLIKEWYSKFPVKASACSKCGACMERCPFDVDIITRMEEAVSLFETD
jgi:predicted aldo/keto reductase-like oxidoreductase